MRGQYVTAPPTEDSTDNDKTDSDLAPSERRVTLRSGLPTSGGGGARFCSEHAECLAWMVTSVALIVLLLRWPWQYRYSILTPILITNTFFEERA